MKSIFSDGDLRNVILDLKLLGEGSFQILYDRGRVKSRTLPQTDFKSRKDEDDGEIPAYYYFHDWSKIKATASLKNSCIWIW